MKRKDEGNDNSLKKGLDSPLLKRRELLLSTVLLIASGGEIVTTGCGGGGSNPQPNPTPSPTPDGKRVAPTVTVKWAARSREVSAPASALSAYVTVVGAQGESTSFRAERPAGTTAAVSSDYTASSAILVGTQVTITIEFFADAYSTGASVAKATAQIPIATDGTLSTPITNIQSNIARVAIPTGLSLEVGEQVYLDYTARDASGSILALGTGSAFFRVVSGADKLQVTGEVATGVLGGSASIVATIDGVQSNTVSVSVLPQIRIAYVDNLLQAVAKGTLDLLKTKNVVVTTFSAMPSPTELQSFDVLMVGQYGSISPSDAPKVKNFIDTGRGVVLLMAAPAVLTGNLPANLSKKDLSAISAWFGATSMLVNTTFERIYAKTVAGVLPLPGSIFPGSLVHTTSTPNALNRDNNILPSVDRVLSNSSDGNGALIYATAYADGLAGRVYWQFNPYGTSGDATSIEKVFALLMSGIRWSAKR
jgi:hypothetical protein